MMKNEQLFMISPPNSAIRSIDLELLKNLTLYIYLIRINPPKLLTKMSMPTMFTQGNQPMAYCEICSEPVMALQEKVQLQKRTIHKECFKCAICDQQLQVGNCALDHVLYRFYGPLWFCQAHMMLGSGQKQEMLKQKHQRAKN